MQHSRITEVNNQYGIITFDAVRTRNTEVNAAVTATINVTPFTTNRGSTAPFLTLKSAV